MKVNLNVNDDDDDDDDVMMIMCSQALTPVSLVFITSYFLNNLTSLNISVCRLQL
jgi:hypothetical protein